MSKGAKDNAQLPTLNAQRPMKRQKANTEHRTPNAERRRFSDKLQIKSGLEFQAKIGVPPKRWRILFAPSGERSYFAIFSAAACWNAYITDEPTISIKSSPFR